MKFIINFFKHSYLVTQLTQEPLEPIEKWSLDVSKLTTTDQMLIASIIRNMGNFPTDWKSNDIKEVLETSSVPHYTPSIFRKKNVNGPEIRFTFGFRSKPRFSGSVFYNYWPDPTREPCINGMPIDIKAAKFIFKKFKSLDATIKAAELAALTAKREMLENEKKWNLVEDLLDMKRNEHGALVPRKTVE